MDDLNKVERGIKLMLPGVEHFGDFRKVVEIAAELGYDFVMLELGGAMEYRTHPEINDGWIEYAAFMNEYPGKTLVVQNSCRWSKNSIHTENGGGGVLSREKIGELLAICNEAGLEVIPEVPTLSHSDYILTRHPEMAERDDDRFPDTACPQNEKYRELVKDILGEVIDLFRPKRINIGHDECYSLGRCPRCKGHRPHELYANDINWMVDFLEQHSVKAIIWGEKLLDAHFMDGEPCGGAEIPETPELEGRAALYPCGELIDRRVGIFHWYWSIARDNEKRYGELGLDFWFGNLSLELLPEASRRLSAPNCRGYVVSNWGRTDMVTMQRNGVLYSMVYAALATNGQNDPDDFEKLDELTRDRLYEMFHKEDRYIEVVHTAHTGIEFEYFFDGRYYVGENYLMGHHLFEDESGLRHRFPVIFGTNISNDTVRSGRFFDPKVNMDRFSVDQLLIETTGMAFPFKGEDGRMLYRTAYTVPAGVKELSYVRFEPASVFVPAVCLISVGKVETR